jgi:4-alpha-glucanotransferase
MAYPSLADRTAGVLLHVTSLPGPHGSGDLGQGAHAFADWVAAAKLRIWQMLPIGPAGYGNSPYSAHSSFAGSPMLVSLEALVEEGLLGPGDLPALPEGRIDWAVVAPAREAALRLAFAVFVKRPARGRSRLVAFARRARPWLTVRGH